MVLTARRGNSDVERAADAVMGRDSPPSGKASNARPPSHATVDAMAAHSHTWSTLPGPVQYSGHMTCTCTSLSERSSTDPSSNAR